VTVPAYVNPDTIHRPALGLTAPPAWGDQLNDDLNNLYARTGQLLGLISFSSSVTYTVPGTTLTVVDATNLAITVTVPLSGNVLVRLRIVAVPDGNQINLGLISGGSVIGPPNGALACDPAGAASEVCNCIADLYITGQTAGAALALEFAASCAAGGGTTLKTGSTFGPAMMEVWAA
jgi:hypothetical protein